jgi:hypothetical protein
MVQMLRPDPDRLYNLLPELYRDADAAHGYPLRALLRLVGGQAELLRADIQQLWDNFFIETCDRWVIPYIGDLVANRTLYDIDLAAEAATAQSLFPDLAPDLRPISTIRTRADVAKTIYYRRRKGTAAMLEELAGDVTGWGAHVVEFFEILTWNQNLNHLRMENSGCTDLRRASACVSVDGPFDAASHLVDVRAIAQSEGWYNVPNLGFFLWRLESFPVPLVRARAMGGTSWRYTFSPLGNSAPLFSRWPRVVRTPGMSPELFLPEPIPPSAFFDDLAGWNALSPPRPDHSLYYGNSTDDTDWSITVYEQAVPGAVRVPVDVADITCLNLDTWTTLTRPSDSRIAIDVRRGRLVIGRNRPPSSAIYVSYNYGFSAHMGSGPYPDRRKWVVPDGAAEQSFDVGAAMTLDAAIAGWAANPPANTIIRIADNDTHTLSASLTLGGAKWLAIQAQPGFRPHIEPQGGAILVTGATPGSTLTLGGLLVEGAIEVAQDIERLRILHTTLVPGRSVEEEAVSPPGGPSIIVHPTLGGNPVNTRARVEIAFSITGPLRIPETVDGLWVLDSIVDGGTGEPAISNAAGTNGPLATIERSTILGSSFFRKLDFCSDTIFTDIVIVEQRDGCLRFSFVPLRSSTPQQYRCQPALEIASQTEAMERAARAAGQTLSPGWRAVLAASIEHWLVPSFETHAYGRPDYCQLRLTAPLQIRTGGSDGAEMGAFNHLKQPQRETNLRIRLDEYVPFGRAAGIIYVT